MNHSVYKSFFEQYGIPDASVFAPGRANIIGEHTDYNDGFVMPFAIGQGVWFFANDNTSENLCITAFDTGEYTIIENKSTDEKVRFGWEKYFRQVLAVLDLHHIKGANIVFGGNLPIGAGVSSSSAITCGFVALLNQLNQWGMNADNMVDTSVKAERGYGVRGGIMDQYTIINGIKNKAILLDCQTNTHEYIDLNMGKYHFCLINTNVKHNLIQTDYNQRRAECEHAVRLLDKHYRNIKSIRDIGMEDLPLIRNLLDDTLFNRVSFVVQENNRVLHARNAILHGNYPKLGELLYESHDGLSQMYHVSCEELDWLVDYSLEADEIAGARMMGGGFGGCTINLINGQLHKETIHSLTSDYEKKFNIKPDIIAVSCEDGIIHHARYGN
ncbi:MAG: galactokinase [Saprospiraceae bacterium]|nr:galactokinase [Saprospiraceae bacterium]MBK8668496.1 galactokinase [Saprospiraceae bacterium]